MRRRANVVESYELPSGIVPSTPYTRPDDPIASGLGFYWLVLLVCGAYSVALCSFISVHHRMVLDEFFAWNILEDPSFIHAVRSWNRGADGGGVLYYVLLWPVVHLSSGSLLVARLCSTLAFITAGAVWWRVLVRFVSRPAATIAVTLVWFSTPMLIGYLALVRFYELFLLVAAMAIWAVVIAADERTPTYRAIVVVFASQAALVLTHVLGCFYGGLLLGSAFIALFPRRRGMVISFAGLLSWLLLLPCRGAMHASSVNGTSQARPSLRDAMRFHLKTATPSLVTALTLLGLVWLLMDLWRNGRGTVPAKCSALFKRLPCIICLPYLFAPLVLVIVSALIRPVGAARYLIPYYLSVAALCAYGIQPICRRWAPFLDTISNRTGTTPRIMLGCVVTAICILHAHVLSQLPADMKSDVETLRRVGTGKPVLVMDELTFFRLQYYASDSAHQFYFLNAPTGGNQSGMMQSIADSNYFPNSLYAVDRFERRFPEFLLLTRKEYVPQPWFPSTRTCRFYDDGDVVIEGSAEKLYEVMNCTVIAEQKRTIKLPTTVFNKGRPSHRPVPPA